MLTNEDLNGFYQLGGVLVVVAGGGFASLRWVINKLKELPSQPATIQRRETTIITADTVAMDRLAGELQTSNERALTGWQLMKEQTEAFEELNDTAKQIVEMMRQGLRKREVAEEVARQLEGETDQELQRRLDARADVRHAADAVRPARRPPTE